jgi:hypothetical protein
VTRVFRYIGEAPKPAKPLVSPALRNAARGRPCTLRWANDCDGGTETTVLAHIRGTWSGIGQKPPDWFGIWCCSIPLETLRELISLDVGDTVKGAKP